MLSRVHLFSFYACIPLHRCVKLKMPAKKRGRPPGSKNAKGSKKPGPRPKKSRVEPPPQQNPVNSYFQQAQAAIDPNNNRDQAPSADDAELKALSQSSQDAGQSQPLAMSMGASRSDSKRKHQSRRPHDESQRVVCVSMSEQHQHALCAQAVHAHAACAQVTPQSEGRVNVLVCKSCQSSASPSPSRYDHAQPSPRPGGRRLW